MGRVGKAFAIVTFAAVMAAGFLAGCSGGADGESAAGDQPQEAPAATAPAQQGASDIPLHYVEYGSGEPLILLHGNGEDGSYFARQMAPFAQRYCVFAVDTRGHGKTERGAAPFTLGQFADDLLGFMDVHGIPQANLLGFSDGANIALIFALRHPERVRKLVLNGANLFPEGLTEETRRQIDAEYRDALAAGDERRIELVRLMVDEPHIDPSELERLGMPVLVVAGTDDMIEESHTRLIAASIPGSQLAILEGTHFVAAENPDAFNRAVMSFLEA